MVYNQLSESENAIWSLLLASGYLKVIKIEIWVCVQGEGSLNQGTGKD